MCAARTLLRLFALALALLSYCGQAKAASSNRSTNFAKREDNAYPFWDDSSSSSGHGSSLAMGEPRNEEEERILEALALIDASDQDMPASTFRPKARDIAALQRDSPHHQSPKKLQKKRKTRKTKRKRTRRSDSRANSPTKDFDLVSANPIPAAEQMAAEVKVVANVSVTAISNADTTSGISMNEKDRGVLFRPPLHESPTIAQGGLSAAKDPTGTVPLTSKTMPRPPKDTTASTIASSTTTPWVRRYLNARTRDVLLPVPKEYIADGFNLAQLAPIVERIGFQAMGAQAIDVAKQLVELPPPQPSYPIYRLALQLLFNENESDEASILSHPLIPPQAIQQAAEALYLMVHARFVCSPRGLDALCRILLSSPVFGKCPRVQCEGTMLLPYGRSNNYTSNAQACQRYCPSCGNLWNCWESKTDGCAWGPSLCYLLLMAHGHDLYPLAGQRQAQVLSTLVHPNNPRVFGFRIHPAAAWGRPLTGS